MPSPKGQETLQFHEVFRSSALERASHDVVKCHLVTMIMRLNKAYYIDVVHCHIHATVQREITRTSTKDRGVDVQEADRSRSRQDCQRVNAFI